MRKLKRHLTERGLSCEGTDAQLKLRLAQFHLLREIENFSKASRGRARSISDDVGVSKRTSLMRRLAQMGNAEMWRNLGNQHVKRYVETFTLVHHVDDESETAKQKLFGKAPLSQNEIDSRVANLKGFVKKHHGVSV